MHRSRIRTTHSCQRRQSRWSGSRWWPAGLACLLTLLSAPTTAVEIPDVPLQSGTPYPAPNILFILDDSGSMTDTFMEAPKNIPDVDADDYCEDRRGCGYFDEEESYVHNTIYYNPAIDYEPWRTADGGRLSGGTSMDAVFTDANLPQGDGWNDPSDDLRDQDFTYYVPKDDIDDYSDITQYYRYQIRRVNDDGLWRQRVVRSEFGRGSSTQVLIDTKPDLSRNDTGGLYFGPYRAPDGADALRFEISGGNGDADLYVENDNWPNGNDECEENGSGNDHTCIIEDNLDDRFYVMVYAPGSWRNRGWFSGVTLTVSTVQSNANSGVADAGCSTSGRGYGWRNCTFATPVTDRTEVAELENFATWYSYHRTRMKVAKAGASEAFNQLGDNYRVGYDSIWNRYGSNGVSGEDPAFPIPVSSDAGAQNDGLFTKGGSNRKDWFRYLHAAVGSGATPLHDALRRAGEYFETDDPWASATGDPISCRLSFAILTTDGYWNSRSRGRTGYGGDVDSSTGPTIERPEGIPGNDFTYQPKKPYMDGRGNTLADVAMDYWNRDLRPALDNNVPESDADPAFWQHMATFGVSIGLAGERNPAFDLPGLTDGSLSWPDPRLSDDSGSAEYASRIDDLWHATINGHGRFVVATDPDEFVNGLISALSTIAERPGSASNVTANSTSFNTDTRVYQASYVSGRWSGDLKAYVATSAGVAGDPEWAASEEIPASRTILTWNGTNGGATFPTAAQKTALDMSGRTHAPATGTQNAAYIAGDRSMEILHDGKLRTRATVLGDIVNSSPIYVVDSETIFVGANDGMLHAFDAETGEERFAYVPGGIDLANLAKLSDPRYGTGEPHKYFVDGPIAVSAKSQTPGKNYLVGALGRGGKGVFALDVTDPDSFDTGDVLWEFRNDSDMGMVLGDPLVVTLNDADRTKAVVVSNGINSTTGKAVLFILNLTTGAVIKEIDTGASGDNGLSAPRGADTNLDGTVDSVYAGDLQGNVWKFDLSSATVGDWGVANSGKAMFVAMDAAGKRQPITAGLALAKHPRTGDIWVFAGTGSFMTNADLTSTDIQSLYGFIDGNVVVNGRTSTSNGDLVKREIVVVGTSAAGRPIRGFETAKDNLEIGKKGWYVDLDEPVAGERIVSGLRVLGTALIASSIVPPSKSTCEAGGSGFINAIDAFTGTSTSEPFFDVNGDGRVDDDDRLLTGTTDADGNPIYVPAGSVDLGIGMPTRPTIIDKLLVVGGSTGRIGSVTINPQGIGARRISWREVLED